jgi:MoxR-like ATPase
VVEQALMTVLSGGHALLVGSRPRQDQAGRDHGHRARSCAPHQFTPDLMPSDTSAAKCSKGAGGKRSFRFITAIFCQLLMADEINRASPRTQSALPQARRNASLCWQPARWPRPSTCSRRRTRSSRRTYPLPEAQLDRFLMQIDVPYPDLENERKIVFDTTARKSSRSRS